MAIFVKYEIWTIDETGHREDFDEKEFMVLGFNQEHILPGDLTDPEDNPFDYVFKKFTINWEE